MSEQAPTRRHPGTEHLLGLLGAWSHLPSDLQLVSAAVGGLAQEMAGQLPDGPELTAGLRKLLEAKDCFVRAALPTTTLQELGVSRANRAPSED